jgi:translation initiation factor 3 subunit L
MKCKDAMKISILSIGNKLMIRFNRLTEKFFQKVPWPEAEAIAPIVNNDAQFLILYRELYYRHIYARLTPTIEHRFGSYDVTPLLHSFLM